MYLVTSRSAVKFFCFFFQLLSVINFSDQICEYTSTVQKCTSLQDLTVSSNFLSVLHLKPAEDINVEFKKLEPIDNHHLFNVTTLEINNLINGIDGDVFKSFNSLTDLWMRNNEIETIRRETFANLNLTVLYLLKNGIRTIEKGAFEDLHNLNTLALSKNKLTIIGRGIYTNLSIYELEFSYNQIEDIEHLALVNLPKLRVIHLDHNRLSKFVAKEILDTPETLVGLWLQNNQLKDIPNYMLEGLNNLTILNISSNSISRIEPNAFSQTPKLRNLLLDNNHLMTLDSNILPIQGLVDLKSFRFDHNRLSFISKNFFSLLPKLGHLTFGGNPWQCGCLDIILSLFKDRESFLQCDEEFINGKRPICVVPDNGDIYSCHHNYDKKLWERYRQFYANYTQLPECFFFLYK